MSRAFFTGVWIGFWSAGGFFFRCIAEGFGMIADFCKVVAGEERNKPD